MFGNSAQLRKDQQGMTAIVITVVLMFVISIIILAFSQTIHREQRNALDNQLSTQAYYAAESGINYAQNVAKNTPGLLTDKTNCGPQAPFTDYNVGENAELTCLLVTSRLQTLEYQGITMESVPVYVKSEAGNVGTLHVSWQSATDTSTAGCGGSVPSNAFPANWSCRQSVLRLDVVPVDPAGSVTADDVKNRQYTIFLYPTTSSSIPTSAYQSGPGAKGLIAAASCRPATGPGTLRPKVCNAQISGINNQAAAVRLMSVYGPADVTLFATNGSLPLKTLVEGQLLIDSTARAADVLKRVQARVPLAGSQVPDFALLSGGAGVCKRYLISAGVASIDGSFPACNP